MGYRVWQSKINLDFPSQNQLELRRLQFNSKRDKEEKIDIDYIAQTQFPHSQKNPDYLDTGKREEFLRNNEISLLKDYQLRAVKKIKNAVIQGNERFLWEMGTGTTFKEISKNNFFELKIPLPS